MEMMKRAWFSGALAVFCAHFTLFWLIVGEARVNWLMPAIVVMLLVVMNIAGLGAFVTARQAPKFRLPLAMTMAPLTAVLGTLSNLLFGFFGVRADLSGFYNDAGLFSMSFTYGIVVSIVGGGIGMWIGRRREDDAVSPPVATQPSVAETLPEISVAPAPVTGELPQIRSD
jgi:amino acid transporter